MGNVLPSAKLFGGDMLGVGVGDGIVNRLCCALVVVEKIRGLDGEFLSIKSFVSVFLCDLRRKASTGGICG